MLRGTEHLWRGRTWAARIAFAIAVGMAAVLTLFAANEPFLSASFAMHMLPSAMVLSGALLGVHRPPVGFVWFLVLALLSVPLHEGPLASAQLALVTGPLLLLAALHATALMPGTDGRGLRAHSP